MTKVENTFYDDTVITVQLNPISQSISYYFNDGSTKDVTPVDYESEVNVIRTNFFELSEIKFVNPRCIHHLIKLIKRVDVVLNGGEVYQVNFEDDDKRDEYLQDYHMNFIEIGNRYYRLNLIHTARCLDSDLIITFTLDGNMRYTVHYATEEEYEYTKQKLSDFGSGGGAGARTSTPVFSVQGGWVEEGTTVEISCSTPNSLIYYTTDGTTPTKESSVYEEPISITEDMTISAFAVAENVKDSFVKSVAYKVKTVVAGNYYKGWLMGSEPLHEITVEELTGLENLVSEPTTSCDSPNPNVYEVPEGLSEQGGRIVWAYPSSFGNVNFVTDENGVKNDIQNSYTKQVLDAEGTEYNIYILTTELTTESGTITATFSRE